MYTGIFFTIEAMFYIILLMIMYFGKTRFKSDENNLYSVLIMISFIELSLELVLDFVGPFYNQLPLISYSVAKIYCVLLQFWITNMCLYVMVVTLNIRKKTNLINKIKKIFYASLIVFIILIVTLPIKFNYDGMVAYTSGMSVNVVYISSFIFSSIGLVCILLNKMQMKNKKFIPMITFLIIGGVGSFLQFEKPGLLLAVPIHAFITFLMYFTIENPDMKLIEELHNSKEISDSANEEKTLFLYNMTQEIRSITKKIDDDADIILDSKDWEETHDKARDIKSNTSRFTNMTNDILDVGSIDETNLKIYNSKYSIKNIIKQLVNVYGDICKNKELKFITNIDHDIPETLYGDSINLKEVLNTILENSIKYTEKGFIEFDVNTIVKNDICRLIFTIEDSGIGIKSDNINKIKLENKSLAKANQLITVMNGTMLISSDYGVGTKVKIILDQKIEISEDKVTTKYESSLEKVEVLAIDDSEAGLKILDKLLKDTNIILDKSNNGKDSLEKIRVSKYDLILLDEELTSISGKELLIKIKEIRNFNTPVILLTKDNNYEYNEEYKNEGFTDYVLKPLKRNILLEVINKYTKKDQ